MAQGSVRSPLATWAGGAAAAHVTVHGAFRSPFMFLLGLGGASTAVVQVIDTHDGVRKKKKKKQRGFTEEIDRREKLRKQIEEVIHPVEIVPLEEVREPEIAREVKPVELKSLESPVIDYAGLAKGEIVARARQDAILKARKDHEELQRKIELKRLEDEEEERELLMILDAIL